MKGYVEKNLRKNETVQAKCAVTWVAFIPIILRSLFICFISWFAPYLATDIYTGLRADGETFFFASDEWGVVEVIAELFFVIVLTVGILYGVVAILKLISIELVVTDKKIIGKVGVIYSNAMDAYLEKIDNFVIDESLLGRIFKYSTITVATASTTLKFPYMQNAVEFKNTVMDCYDARKTELMKEQAELIGSVGS